MRSNDEVIQLFREAVSEVDNKAKIETIEPDTKLADIGLDSVMTMEVIAALEDKLEVRFPDEDLSTISSVSDLARLINRLEA